MTCSHSWLAETPKGPRTRMVCKWCEAVQYRKSYMTDHELNRVVLYGSRRKEEVEV